MTDLGQRVVLGADRDDQLSAAVGGIEGRRQIDDPVSDRETVLRQQVRHFGSAAELLEGEFRVAVNRMRQRNQIGLYGPDRSEEHTSELQSLMRISYAVFCLKKKTKHKQ